VNLIISLSHLTRSFDSLQRTASFVLVYPVDLEGIFDTDVMTTIWGLNVEVEMQCISTDMIASVVEERKMTVGAAINVPRLGKALRRNS
jgi:hypothetical protein